MIKHKHLILIGMMGSGKTTTGAQIAQQLNRRHIDLDQYICSQYEKSIQEIIQLHTLENFRILEEQIFNKLLENHSSPLVISLGGGTFTHKNELCDASSHETVYLKCSLQTLINRLAHPIELESRPLIMGLEPKRLEITLKNLIKSREPLYLQAKYCLECDDLSPQQIIDKIVALI